MPRGSITRRAACLRSINLVMRARTYSGMERSDKFCPPSSKTRGRRAACLRSRLRSKSIRNLKRLSRSDLINEKAVRQQDGLLFQGRIVPTEFEKDHQNFLAKSYWAVKGSVKGFFENRYLCFQRLNNLINMPLRMTKNVTREPLFAVSSSFSATYRPA